MATVSTICATAGVEFRAISVDSSLDPGDAVAIAASGQLHLRLSKESYQKIGLPGSKSDAYPGSKILGGIKTTGLKDIFAQPRRCWALSASNSYYEG